MHLTWSDRPVFEDLFRPLCSCAMHTTKPNAHLRRLTLDLQLEALGCGIGKIYALDVMLRAPGAIFASVQHNLSLFAPHVHEKGLIPVCVATQCKYELALKHATE